VSFFFTLFNSTFEQQAAYATVTETRLHQAFYIAKIKIQSIPKHGSSGQTVLAWITA
jgi:hypothetical protein